MPLNQLDAISHLEEVNKLYQNEKFKTFYIYSQLFFLGRKDLEIRFILKEWADKYKKNITIQMLRDIEKQLVKDELIASKKVGNKKFLVVIFHCDNMSSNINETTEKPMKTGLKELLEAKKNMGNNTNKAPLLIATNEDVRMNNSKQNKVRTAKQVRFHLDTYGPKKYENEEMTDKNHQINDENKNPCYNSFSSHVENSQSCQSNIHHDSLGGLSTPRAKAPTKDISNKENSSNKDNLNLPRLKLLYFSSIIDHLTREYPEFRASYCLDKYLSIETCKKIRKLSYFTFDYMNRVSAIKHEAFLNENLWLIAEAYYLQDITEPEEYKAIIDECRVNVGQSFFETPRILFVEYGGEFIKLIKSNPTNPLKDLQRVNNEIDKNNLQDLLTDEQSNATIVNQ